MLYVNFDSTISTFLPASSHLFVALAKDELIHCLMDLSLHDSPQLPRVNPPYENQCGYIHSAVCIYTQYRVFIYIHSTQLLGSTPPIIPMPGHGM